MKFRLQSYFDKNRFVCRNSRKGWGWGTFQDSHVWLTSDDFVDHTQFCMESCLNTHLIVVPVAETFNDPHPPGSPAHEEMLESLILLGLDPDHVEILRTWPVQTLADFSLSLTDIIQRARTEALNEVDSQKPTKGP